MSLEGGLAVEDVVGMVSLEPPETYVGAGQSRLHRDNDQSSAARSRKTAARPVQVEGLRHVVNA
jgi:hypothetical protein